MGLVITGMICLWVVVFFLFLFKDDSLLFLFFFFIFITWLSSVQVSRDAASPTNERERKRERMVKNDKRTQGS